jgi:hypothetical protein
MQEDPSGIYMQNTVHRGGLRVALTSVALKPASPSGSRIGPLLLGVTTAVLWIGGNIWIPWLAPTGIPSAVLRLAIYVAILTGVWLGLRRTDFSASKRVRVWLAIALPFTMWMALVWYLAVTGTFHVTPGAARLPRLPVAIFLPVIIALPALLWSRPVAKLLDATPASWLIALQVYRVFGGIFLVNWLSGNVAGIFAWPAGIGDVATGIAALPVALAVGSGTASGHRAGLWWNVFGLVDFAVAITMGFLTSPGPFQYFGFNIPVSQAGTYPTVMIPAFAVPSSILLHALSIRQLKRRKDRIAAPEEPHDVARHQPR